MKKTSLLFFAILLVNNILFSQSALKIANGTVKISGDAKLVLKDAKLINNSTFTATNGTVYLTGTTATSNASIEGVNSSTFHNLTINKTANNAQLGQNIITNNTLNLENGQLDLANFNLTLNGGYTLNNGNYVLTSGTGTLIQEVLNGGSKTFPIGNNTYTPIEIQNAGTTDNYAVRSVAEVLDNGNTGTPIVSNVVNKTWFIEESTIGGSDLTLTATWNTADEMTSFDRTQCYISHYIGSRWDGASNNVALGSNPYTISRSGITSLSPFAIGSNEVLPIDLLSFKAVGRREKVELNWSTGTEINSAYFDAEYSIDAIHFEKIGNIPANGFSNSTIDYAFSHNNPIQGFNYYRLKLVDIDGTFKYSKIICVDFLSQAFALGESFALYPNPARDILQLQFSEKIKSAQLELYNELGQLVLENRIHSTSRTSLSISQLPSGVYFFNIIINDKRWAQKITIQD